MTMRARLRDLALPVAAATAIAGVMAELGLRTMAFTDYELEAHPALALLRSGDLGGFFGALPSYGGSLMMRSPFALAPEAWSGGDLSVFRSMAVPCVVAGVVLAVVLWQRAASAGVGLAGRGAVLALCAGNPLTLRALEIGHPEELLGAVLCVAAALAAGARRPLAAGVLLGLAVANKPWALVAVAPVLIMLSSGRLRALAAAGATAAAFLVPLLVLGGVALAQTKAVASDAGTIFQPWQVWWFAGDHGPAVVGTFGPKPGFRTPPEWISAVAKPLVVLVPLAVSLLLARRVRLRPWHDGLLLLALALLLRCLLDPWNVVYYPLPFLLALLAWEVHARPGTPVLSLAATGLCWVTLEQLTRVLSPDLQAAAFLAWSVPLAVGLTAHLAAPAQSVSRGTPISFSRRVRPPRAKERISSAPAPSASQSV